MVGLSNQSAIAVFTREHKLQGELAYITTEREGEPWYILLYGVYANYAEAAKALAALPDALKSQQPWIRKMPQQGTINRL
jgi:DamX protein